MMGRVILTGATGFIGSYLAETLVAQGYEVIGLRRNQSDLWRLAAVQDRIQWVNTDEPDWEQRLLAHEPEYLVHSAWLGVEAGQRDQWDSQLTNLSFTLRLLQLVAQGPLKKVVVLGSQAEYGSFEGRIDEQQPANPTVAYGAVKLATLDLLRAFCQARGIEWYWLRVFAVFGPREDPHWFISFVAASLLKQEAPNLTACEQRYDYFFVEDLARSIVQTLPAPVGRSGVYNISSDRATSLKEIVELIRALTNSNITANYGAVAYRPGQVMHMEGNSAKFEEAFGTLARTPLPDALAATVAFVKASL